MGQLTIISYVINTVCVYRIEEKAILKREQRLAALNEQKQIDEEVVSNNYQAVV